MSIAGFYGIHLPYILAVMFRVRMVGFMHPNSFRIMVDCYVNAISRCQLNTCRCTAATGKIVHN